MQKKLNKQLRASFKEIYAMKKIAGFNNDWDVSFALIDLLINDIGIEDFRKKVIMITPKIRKSGKYQEIKDIFQSYYLGFELFRKVYNRAPIIKINTGLITAEKKLLSIGILEQLSRKYKLAIATSRPRFEAVFATNYQEISPRIIDENFIIAKEDCKREKPFPDPLIEAAKRIRASKSVYIGDTVNDVIAAKKAGMISIYVGKETIGDYQVKSVNKIAGILL
jgi:HAD superfamily hydrolase (TIGR01548 family)